MAECVISRDMVEADDVLAGGVAPFNTVCMVHTSYAPCPHNGEPASTVALHADDMPGQSEVIRFWWLRTRGQRTLVMHRGTFADDHEQTVACWCEPEVFLATDEPSPLPEH